MLENKVCRVFIEIILRFYFLAILCSYSDFGERKGWAATEYFRNSMKSLDPLQKTENLILESMPQFIPPTTTDTNKTWYMQAKEEV